MAEYELIRGDVLIRLRILTGPSSIILAAQAIAFARLSCRLTCYGSQVPPASSYRQAAHGARSVLEATTSLSRAPVPPTLFFSNIGAAAPAPTASPATFRLQPGGQQPSLQRKAARTVAWELDEASPEAAEVQPQPQRQKGLVSLLRDSYPKSPTRPGSAVPAYVPISKATSRVPVTPSRSAVVLAAHKSLTTTSKPSTTTLTTSKLPATNPTTSKRGVKVTATDAAVAAALHVLRSKPPSQPLIQALLRYTTYNPQIATFEDSALSKSKRPGSAGRMGSKRGKSTAPNQSTKPAAEVGKSPVKAVRRLPEGKGASATRDSVASEDDQLMSALQHHYGEPGVQGHYDNSARQGHYDEPGQGPHAMYSQFEDDTALRQEMEANFASSAPAVASSGPTARSAMPSLGGATLSVRSISAKHPPAVKKAALDPGLLFSSKQKRESGGEEGGAAMLQKQMAQMAAAMAGMGGLAPPGGPMAAAVGSGGFQASSVVLWEVMSLVLMRSVLSSAVGAMSTQMTSMAQHVRPGGGRRGACILCHSAFPVSLPSNLRYNQY